MSAMLRVEARTRARAAWSRASSRYVAGGQDGDARVALGSASRIGDLADECLQRGLAGPDGDLAEATLAKLVAGHRHAQGECPNAYAERGPVLDAGGDPGELPGAHVDDATTDHVGRVAVFDEGQLAVRVGGRPEREPSSALVGPRPRPRIGGEEIGALLAGGGGHVRCLPRETS